MTRLFINLILVVLCTYSQHGFAQEVANDQKAEANSESSGSGGDEKAEIPEDLRKLLEESNRTKTPESNVSNSGAEVRATIITKDDIKLGAENQSSIVNNSLIYWIFIGILLAANCVAYSKVPRARKFLISIPFDIGVKAPQAEESAVKRKRILIEFVLLMLVFVFWIGGPADILRDNDVRFFGVVYIGIQFYLMGYLFFVVSRFFAGYYYKCPSCKTPFAAACTNSWNEPKSTFEKKYNGSEGTRKVYFVKVMEAGVVHKDWRCNSCNHEWKTARSYTRQISSHREYV